MPIQRREYEERHQRTIMSRVSPRCSKTRKQTQRHVETLRKSRLTKRVGGGTVLNADNISGFLTRMLNL